nr:HAD family hydrolase [uncultured Lachnoclostridium sp.]
MESKKKVEMSRTGEIMNQYAIFFDIDGTIVPEDKGGIPDSTIEAIRLAKKNGHYTFINTGRTYIAIDQFIKDISFDGFVCGCGTNIYLHGQEIMKQELGHQKSIQIVEDLLAYNIDGILEGNDCIYYRNECLHPEVDMIKHYRDAFNNQAEFQKLWDDPDITFDKMALWIVEGSDFDSFRKKYELEFEVIERKSDFFELIPAGFSKATGMDVIAEYLHIPKEHTIAIGDSTNDLSMLANAGISIAMGNSNPYLFDKVDYVTADIHEDGIYKALEHYNII